jgi:O-antigen ligase
LFDHPNILGGVMGFGILAIVFLLIKKEGQAKQRKINHYFIFIVFGLILAGLILTFSRAAWLACLLSLLVYLFLAFVRKNYSKRKVLLKVVLVFSLAFLSFYTIYPDIFATRLSGESRLELKSGRERIELISQARDVIRENFWIGTGVGNYAVNLNQGNPKAPAWSYQPVHNAFLLVWAEVGFFAFLFFLAIIFYAFKKAWSRKSAWSFSLLVLMATLMIFDHWWWSLHFGVLFFWFGLGLCYALEE